MPDYASITHEEFDEKLEELVGKMTPAGSWRCRASTRSPARN